jgi:N-acetylglucosamine-6-phosphate deacetylase
MREAFVNGHILTGGRVVSGLAVVVNGGIIDAILPDEKVESSCDIVDLGGRTLLPGFVDLQVNGGGGLLFNDNPCVETIRAIAHAHYQFGVTSFLPTIISDDVEKVRMAVAAVDEAIAKGVPGVVGIHIEGPYLNVERKGIHNADKIRKLDAEGMAAISGLRNGKTLMTLAPEQAEFEQISQLAASGIILAAGHTNGSYDQIIESFRYGVTGVTHLFNAMSPLTNREPGAVGAALENPDCWCCIIVDGKHVHPASFRIAIAAKGGPQRFILVSDAMPTVGSTDKVFTLGDQEVRVVDGVCQNADGTLAGSDLDMALAVKNAVASLGVTLAEAVQMASLNPARFLGLDSKLGSIELGMAANFALVDDAGSVLGTWINGELVTCPPSFTHA